MLMLSSLLFLLKENNRSRGGCGLFESSPWSATGGRQPDHKKLPRLVPDATVLKYTSRESAFYAVEQNVRRRTKSGDEGHRGVGQKDGMI
jgi:hypothetical protein